MYVYFYTTCIFFGFIIFICISFSLLKKRTILSKLLTRTREDVASEVENDKGNKVILSSMYATKENIKEKFEMAGIYDFEYYKLYMPLKYVSLFVGLILIIVINLSTVDLAQVILYSAIYIVCVILLPDFVLHRMKFATNHKIRTKLPYLLDLLAVCVQTGLTLEASISYLSNELKDFDKHLCKLLLRLNHRSRIIGLDRALDEIYSRYPSAEMRSFVITLKQNVKYGNSIYDTLVRLSTDIREVGMLSVEEKIGKLSAKMSIPLILFIMFPIVIIIVAPGVMRMLA